jgi:aspartyl protease family protein
MRQIIILASVVLVVGATVPKLIDKFGLPAKGGSSQHALAAVPAPSPTPSSYRTVTVGPDRQGHFRVEARVEGRRLDFMVDTGASLIALTARDAERLGVHPAQSEFTARVGTANGVVKGAPVRLASIEVGGLVVREVQALVLPDEALSENLLGLSFLSRLRRFEYARGKLVLEQ